jgi:hypothetical protein
VCGNLKRYLRVQLILFRAMAFPQPSPFAAVIEGSHSKRERECRETQKT